MDNYYDDAIARAEDAFRTASTPGERLAAHRNQLAYARLKRRAEDNALWLASGGREEEDYSSWFTVDREEEDPDGEGETDRLRVPGGWLLRYRTVLREEPGTVTYGPAVMTFVPDPRS